MHKQKNAALALLLRGNLKNESTLSEIGFVSHGQSNCSIRVHSCAFVAQTAFLVNSSVRFQMQSALAQIVERLKVALGDRLISVILYGSAATGDQQKGYSDLNVLCVLGEITPRELVHTAPVFRWWREQGNPAPLLLTRREFETSTDCFAIEFHDIRDQHQILFGEDVVQDLQIDDSFYRAQVEHELRAKLLRLRHKAAVVLNDRQLLSRLLADSVSTFSVLFRHALVLHGVEAPLAKREVVAKAAAFFNFDAAPFEWLLDLRDGKPVGQDVDFENLLQNYMMQVSTVIDAVDRL
jgi:hypothetical protein